MQRLTFILAVALAPFSATADCAAEIAALFDGGAWDPFTRANRHEVTVARQPDGSETPVSDVLWDGPLKSINCTPNGCFLAIGAETWRGETAQGPWAAMGSTGVEDPEGFVRETRDLLAASVSAPECLGTVSLDGEEALAYRFFSKPEPNRFGSWWGGRYTVWLSPDAERIVRIDLAEGIASWAPDPSAAVQTTIVTENETISISAPEG